jgi:pimeloyl-ACP methyl ester carboxylesterase
MKAIANPGQTMFVDNIEMYYEMRGEGEPLLLLHGGGGIGANWNLIFPRRPTDIGCLFPTFEATDDPRTHQGSSRSDRRRWTYLPCSIIWESNDARPLA